MKLRETNISKPRAPKSKSLLQLDSRRNIRKPRSRSKLRSASTTFFFTIGLIVVVFFTLILSKVSIDDLRVDGLDNDMYTRNTNKNDNIPSYEFDSMLNSEVSDETQNVSEQRKAGIISDIISRDSLKKSHIRNTNKNNSIPSYEFDNAPSINSMINSNNSISMSTESVTLQYKKYNNKKEKKGTKRGKYAIAYVIGGCQWKDWNSMDSCVPYILNAIVTAHVLRTFHSSIDVVLKVRMAASSTETSFAELSPEIEDWLSKSGVILSYLPKVRKDNFGTVSMEMFRTLEMLDYDRVLFMDSDSYPTCNIDSHFDLSFNGQLEENIGFAGSAAPITASALMVTPKSGAFHQVMDIIHRHRNNSSKSKTKLDPIQGWGHPIVNEVGDVVQKWDWFGVDVDQGIIYEWLMHEIKNFTLIEGGNYLTYQEVVPKPTLNQSNHKNNTYQMISFLANKKSPSILACHGGDGTGKTSLKDTIQGAIVHFSGGGKPWGQGGISVSETLTNKTVHNETKFREFGGKERWRYWLSEANRTYSLHLPSRLELTARQPVGSALSAQLLLSPNVEIPVPNGSQGL